MSYSNIDFDVERIRQIQEVQTEILMTLHQGLKTIARVKEFSSDTTAVRCIAEQTLIEAEMLAQKLFPQTGGDINA